MEPASNPKNEARNRKQTRMLQIRMTKTGEPYQGIARFGHLNSEFVSDFGFLALLGTSPS
jgi:hypothetical protein